MSLANADDPSPYYTLPGGTTTVTQPSTTITVPTTSTPAQPAPNGNRVTLDKLTAKTLLPRTPVTLTGTIVNSAGAPLAGAPLLVVTRPDSTNSASTIVARGTSDAKGHYAFTIKPTTSVFIAVINSDTGGNASSATVRIREKPKVTLTSKQHALRNGQTLKVTGKVDAPSAIDARGKLVEIQVRTTARGKWEPADLVRTRPSGNVAWSYRFHGTTRQTTYRFRLRVRVDAGWPYVTGTSPQVAVAVRP